MFRRTLLVLWIYVFPLVAPWAILGAVNAGDPSIPAMRSRIPDEPASPDRCTWACHNHGCRHAPVLPAALAADAGLFGAAVRALHRAGRAFSRDRAIGYGAANIVVLCAGWPLLMYVLWVMAFRQGLEIRRLRREKQA